jgi:hypothetical protein
MHDLDGEATIPVDLFSEPEPDPAALPTPPPGDPSATNPTADPNAPRFDAGAPRDAGPRDAALDAPTDGPSLDARVLDASRPISDAALPEAGPVPLPPAPRTAHDLIGVAGDVQAGDQYVVLLINASVIRKNPVGAQMGPLLTAIPQWDSFIAGTNIDPIKQTDWVAISGPSLMDTGRDVIIVHYSAPDAVVDQAVDVVTKRSSPRSGAGGPVDAGVPGVHAALGTADRYDRVFLRGPSGWLAVVPADIATREAQNLLKVRGAPKFDPDMAMRLTVKSPHKALSLVPEELSEVRMRILSTNDGGADVLIDGEAKDETDAGAAENKIKDTLGRFTTGLQGGFISMATDHLLEGIQVRTEGKLVTVSLHASTHQLSMLLGFVEAEIKKVNPAFDANRAVVPSGAPR